MRILYLIPQDAQSPYGNGRALPIANALAEQGHTVTALLLHANYAAAKRGWLEIGNVRARYVAQSHVKKIGNTKSYFRPLMLGFIILNAMFHLGWHSFWVPTDLVIIGKAQPIAGFIGYALAKLKRVPIWVDADDYEAGSNRFGSKLQQRVLAWSEKWLCCNANVVLTNTAFMEAKIKGWSATQSVKRLPNGIAPHWFVAIDNVKIQQLKTQLGLQGQPIIGFIGSLSAPSHPVTLLLQAFTQLLMTQPNATLLIVGGGEDWDSLQEEAQSLGIAAACCFIGRVAPDQVKNYYPLCTVTIDPLQADDAARSRAPLKLFEAWATGTPFITSLIGERQTLYSGLPTEWFPKAGDVNALAQAITQVVSDKAIRERLIKHGNTQIERYRWNLLVQDLFNDD